MLGALFGGGKKGPSVSHGERQSGRGMEAFFGNRLGAKPISTDKDGRITFDWSNTGKSMSIPEATAGYDFSGYDKAINQNPYQYSFSSLPDQYYNDQYNLGAKDVRREGQGQLDQYKRAIGTRRPGLLLKSQETSGRQIGENLASLGTTLRGQAMKEKSDLGRMEQMAQADENYRVNQGIANATQNKIGQQAAVTEAERANIDKAYEYMLQHYLSSQSSRRGSGGGGGGGGGLLGTAAGIASKFI